MHVKGEIEYGRLHEALRAAKGFKDYRERKGYVVPRVCLGLSGPMNTLLMKSQYDDLKGYEEEEAALAVDEECAKLASQMSYIEGTIYYEVFKEL